MSADQKWQALSAYFKERRGRGVSYTTIQSWQALGMPYLQSGPHAVWFDPPVCWEWYLEQFMVRRG